jgi:hypothetical protein
MLLQVMFNILLILLASMNDKEVKNWKMDVNAVVCVCIYIYTYTH